MRCVATRTEVCRLMSFCLEVCLTSWACLAWCRSASYKLMRWVTTSRYVAYIPQIPTCLMHVREDCAAPSGYVHIYIHIHITSQVLIYMYIHNKSRMGGKMALQHQVDKRATPSCRLHMSHVSLWVMSLIYESCLTSIPDVRLVRCNIRHVASRNFDLLCCVMIWVNSDIFSPSLSLSLSLALSPSLSLTHSLPHTHSHSLSLCLSLRLALFLLLPLSRALSPSRHTLTHLRMHDGALPARATVEWAKKSHGTHARCVGCQNLYITMLAAHNHDLIMYDDISST
jgi:hypothetical protein